MTRRRLGILALLATAAGAAVLFTPTAAAYIAGKPTPAPTTIAVERLAATVPVTDMAAVLIKRPSGMGSGFYIGNGLVVTAAHVVKGAKTVSIKTEDGRISSARIILIDEDKDVAIMRTGRRGMLAAEMNCNDVPVGTPIVSHGNPLGLEFVASYGTIAGAPRTMNGKSYYVTDMTTVMGQSGSGVWADGKVVGVTSAVMTAPLELVGKIGPDAGIYSRSIVGFGFVVPSSVVCEMLAGLEGVV